MKEFFAGQFDIAVIGAGHAGIEAALAAARMGLETVCLTMNLDAVGNMPCNPAIGGTGKGHLVRELDALGGEMGKNIDRTFIQSKMLNQSKGPAVHSLRAQADKEMYTRQMRLVMENTDHLTIKQAEITEILTEEGKVTGVKTLSGAVYHCRAVVLATGADPRTLGVAGETELLGRGVAYCAACDGMFYKDKTVVVVGGGNSAAADALLLSRVAKKVILVHRRDTLRATKIYHEPLEQAENVEFRWNSTVSALLSGDRLTGVRLRDTVTGEESVVDCDGVFVSVGRQPATALAVGQLALDGGGYIVAGETTETSISGVYAVGDVRTKPLRQVVTAVADGAMAVHMAEKYIAENR